MRNYLSAAPTQLAADDVNLLNKDAGLEGNTAKWTGSPADKFVWGHDGSEIASFEEGSYFRRIFPCKHGASDLEGAWDGDVNRTVAPDTSTSEGNGHAPAAKKRRLDTVPNNSKHIRTVASLPCHEWSSQPLSTPQREAPHFLTSYCCPICLEPPRNAVATPCGHMMCGECLFQCVKSEALQSRDKAQREQRLAVVCSMARGLPDASPSPSNLSTSVTRSRFMYFISAHQIGQILDKLVRTTANDVFRSFITDVRPKPDAPGHEPWLKLLGGILDVTWVHTPREGDDIDTVRNLLRQRVSTYLITTAPLELSSLLCGTREPRGFIEGVLVDACARLPSSNSCGWSCEEVPSKKICAAIPPVVSYLASAGAMSSAHENLMGVSQLAWTLKQTSTRLPLDKPVVSGIQPQIVPNLDTVRTLLRLTKAGNVGIALQSATTVSTEVCKSLVRLSAFLWFLSDGSDRTLEEYISAAQSQQADVSRRHDPHFGAGSGLRLTAEELDPMTGTCPVCRGQIPGGFFGKIRNRGVQGLQLKMGKPSPKRPQPRRQM